MKKISIFAILACFTISLTGCAKVWVKEKNPMEIWGASGQVFQGRLYSASSWHRNSAIKKLAQIAKKNGYNYFTLLQDRSDLSGTYTNSFNNADANASVIGNEVYLKGNSSNYSYTAAQYQYNILALFLNDDELHNWKNIYSVSDYTR